MSNDLDQIRRDRLTSTALWSALGVIFLLLVLQINRRISSGHSGDFRHFYFAAGALLDHRDLYGPVPIDIVERALRRPARAVERAWYTTDQERYLYPPLIAMLYTPIAPLRFETAQRIMLTVNAMLIIAGIALTSRTFVQRFQMRQIGWLIPAAALLGTILNLDKVHLEMQMFQTNALMFCMFAVSLYWLEDSPLLAGAPLGLILNIKYLSIGLLPWLIIRRRWRTAFSCVISAVFFALVPAVMSGWQENLHNLSIAYGGLLHMIGIHGAAEQANVDDIRDYLSCSITSAMARTTRAGQSLLLPMVASAIIAIVAALMIVGMYLRKGIPIFRLRDHVREVADRANSRSNPGLSAGTDIDMSCIIAIEFVSIVATTLCFSPQTNTRHLVLALLITIPLSALILERKWPAIVGALLIGAGFIFPPGGQAPASHHLALWWFGIGGQCWCLLIAMLLLIAIGAPNLRRDAR